MFPIKKVSGSYSAAIQNNISQDTVLPAGGADCFERVASGATEAAMAADDSVKTSVTLTLAQQMATEVSTVVLPQLRAERRDLWTRSLAHLLELLGTGTEAVPTVEGFIAATQKGEQSWLRRTGDGVARWDIPTSESDLLSSYAVASRVIEHLDAVTAALNTMKQALPAWQLNERVRDVAAIIIHGGFGNDLIERAALAHSVQEQFGPHAPVYYLTNPRPLFIEEKTALAAVLSPALQRSKEEIVAALQSIATENKQTIKDLLPPPKSDESGPQMRQNNRRDLSRYVDYVKRELMARLGIEAWPFTGFADVANEDNAVDALSRARSHSFHGWPVPYDYLAQFVDTSTLHYSIPVLADSDRRVIATTVDTIVTWQKLDMPRVLQSSAEVPVVGISSGLTHRQHVVTEKVLGEQLVIRTIEPSKRVAAGETNSLIAAHAALQELDSLARLAFSVRSDLAQLR